MAVHANSTRALARPLLRAAALPPHQFTPLAEPRERPGLRVLAEPIALPLSGLRQSAPGIYLFKEAAGLRDRRGFLSGLVSLPLIGAVGSPALSDTPPPDSMNDLWLSFLRARGAYEATSTAWQAAYDLLPWWVKSGPSRLRSDGSLSGPERGFTAIQDMEPPSTEGAFRNIRPSPLDIHELYDLHVSLWGSHVEAKAAEARDQQLVALREREAAAQIEKERVGEPALNTAHDLATDAMFEIEDAILELDPATPAIIAMQLILRAMGESSADSAIATSSEMALAALGLRGILPMLTGEIAADAAAFIADRERPFGRMRSWAGIPTAEVREADHGHR